MSLNNWFNRNHMFSIVLQSHPGPGTFSRGTRLLAQPWAKFTNNSLTIIHQERESNIDTMFLPISICNKYLLLYFGPWLSSQISFTHIYICDRNVFKPWIVVDVISVVNPHLSSVSPDYRQIIHFRGCEVSEDMEFHLVSSYSFLW